VTASVGRLRPQPLLGPAAILASLVVLAVGVATGSTTRGAAGLVVLVTIAALTRVRVIGWPRILGGLIVLILFVPIRRYTLPVNLPFQLEPYRIYVIGMVVIWFASLLVDRRVRLRKTGVDAPVALIVLSAAASIAANPDRVAALGSAVDKKLMFFLSFLLVLYVTSSVVRRLDAVDALAKTLVGGGGVVAFFAVIEARTGFNVFNHLERFVPLLRPGGDGEPVAFQKFGSANLRVFASAQHPIALSAMFVVLTPLSIYLARRYRQRRWYLTTLLLVAACASTVSRTGILMFVVVIIVFLWLRPRETRRFWPAIFPALIVIHFVLPGTIGSLKQSFFPAGGLVAEQESMAGKSGSGRLADIGPALREWRREPLVGQGFGTRVVDAGIKGPRSNILDDQWLGTLIETGAIGAFGWLWLFVRAVRRFGREAKRDDSERGWLLVSLAAGIASFAVGMLTYDAFSFIQVTFLVFIYLGLGAALLAERPTPLSRGTLAPTS
jgi:polysaccharide biosynthesis protein PslJ